MCGECICACVRCPCGGHYGFCGWAEVVVTDRWGLGDDEWPWKKTHLPQTALAGSAFDVCLAPSRGGWVEGWEDLEPSSYPHLTTHMAGTPVVAWTVTPPT